MFVINTQGRSVYILDPTLRSMLRILFSIFFGLIHCDSISMSGHFWFFV